MKKKPTKEHTTTIFKSSLPVFPELLDPLFDSLGLGKEADSRSESPEQKEKARKATLNYFLKLIKDWRKKGIHPTMGTIRGLSCAFYDGYLAGQRGIIHPPIHP